MRQVKIWRMQYSWIFQSAFQKPILIFAQQQQESVDQIENNVEVAAENVREGTKLLISVRMRSVLAEIFSVQRFFCSDTTMLVFLANRI